MKKDSLSQWTVTISPYKLVYVWRGWICVMVVGDTNRSHHRNRAWSLLKEGIEYEDGLIQMQTNTVEL